MWRHQGGSQADIEKWCATSKKVLLKYHTEGTTKIAKIQF
jgi:TusA-related sulfurtransferase